ncbi:hypothetical protein ACFL6C_08220 [Myxococcota bacterium]
MAETKIIPKQGAGAIGSEPDHVGQDDQKIGSTGGEKAGQEVDKTVKKRDLNTLTHSPIMDPWAVLGLGSADQYKAKVSATGETPEVTLDPTEIARMVDGTLEVYVDVRERKVKEEGFLSNYKTRPRTVGRVQFVIGQDGKIDFSKVRGDTLQLVPGAKTKSESQVGLPTKGPKVWDEDTEPEEGYERSSLDGTLRVARWVAVNTVTRTKDGQNTTGGMVQVDVPGPDCLVELFTNPNELLGTKDLLSNDSVTLLKQLGLNKPLSLAAAKSVSATGGGVVVEDVRAKTDKKGNKDPRLQKIEEWIDLDSLALHFKGHLRPGRLNLSAPPGLGEILVEAGVLTEIQVQDAMTVQESTSPPKELRDVILEMGLTTEDKIVQALAEAKGKDDEAWIDLHSLTGTSAADVHVWATTKEVIIDIKNAQSKGFKLKKGGTHIQGGEGTVDLRLKITGLDDPNGSRLELEIVELHGTKFVADLPFEDGQTHHLEADEIHIDGSKGNSLFVVTWDREVKDGKVISKIGDISMKVPKGAFKGFSGKVLGRFGDGELNQVEFGKAAPGTRGMDATASLELDTEKNVLRLEADTGSSPVTASVDNLQLGNFNVTGKVEANKGATIEVVQTPEKSSMKMAANKGGHLVVGCTVNSWQLGNEEGPFYAKSAAADALAADGEPIPPTSGTMYLERFEAGTDGPAKFKGTGGEFDLTIGKMKTAFVEVEGTRGTLSVGTMEYDGSAASPSIDNICFDATIGAKGTIDRPKRIKGLEKARVDFDLNMGHTTVDFQQMSLTREGDFLIHEPGEILLNGVKTGVVVVQNTAPVPEPKRPTNLSYDPAEHVIPSARSGPEVAEPPVAEAKKAEVPGFSALTDDLDPEFDEVVEAVPKGDVTFEAVLSEIMESIKLEGWYVSAFDLEAAIRRKPGPIKVVAGLNQGEVREGSQATFDPPFIVEIKGRWPWQKDEDQKTTIEIPIQGVAIQKDEQGRGRFVADIRFPLEAHLRRMAAMVGDVPKGSEDKADLLQAIKGIVDFFDGVEEEFGKRLSLKVFGTETFPLKGDELVRLAEAKADTGLGSKTSSLDRILGLVPSATGTVKVDQTLPIDLGNNQQVILQGDLQITKSINKKGEHEVLITGKAALSDVRLGNEQEGLSLASAQASMVQVRMTYSKAVKQVIVPTEARLEQVAAVYELTVQELRDLNPQLPQEEDGKIPVGTTVLVPVFVPRVDFRAKVDIEGLEAHGKAGALPATLKVAEADGVWIDVKGIEVGSKEPPASTVIRLPDVKAEVEVGGKGGVELGVKDVTGHTAGMKATLEGKIDFENGKVSGEGDLKVTSTAFSVSHPKAITHGNNVNIAGRAKFTTQDDGVLIESMDPKAPIKASGNVAVSIRGEEGEEDDLDFAVEVPGGTAKHIKIWDGSTQNGVSIFGWKGGVDYQGPVGPSGEPRLDLHPDKPGDPTYPLTHFDGNLHIDDKGLMTLGPVTATNVCGVTEGVQTDEARLNAFFHGPSAQFSITREGFFLRDPDDGEPLKVETHFSKLAPGIGSPDLDLMSSDAHSYGELQYFDVTKETMRLGVTNGTLKGKGIAKLTVGPEDSPAERLLLSKVFFSGKFENFELHVSKGDEPGFRGQGGLAIQGKVGVEEAPHSLQVDAHGKMTMALNINQDTISDPDNPALAVNFQAWIDAVFELTGGVGEAYQRTTTWVKKEIKERFGPKARFAPKRDSSGQTKDTGPASRSEGVKHVIGERETLMQLVFDRYHLEKKSLTSKQIRGLLGRLEILNQNLMERSPLGISKVFVGETVYLPTLSQVKEIVPSAHT